MKILRSLAAVFFFLLAVLPALARDSNQQIVVVAAETGKAGSGLAAANQVQAHVVLPSGEHVSLWCSNWSRRCWRPEPGVYDADVDIRKGIVWIKMTGGNWNYSGTGSPGVQKNSRMIKFQISGNWAGSDGPSAVVPGPSAGTTLPPTPAPPPPTTTPPPPPTTSRAPIRTTASP